MISILISIQLLLPYPFKTNLGLLGGKVIDMIHQIFFVLSTSFFSVVLVQSGDVYTFGSNSYGQLGVGDMMVRGGPVHVKVPMAVSLIAAGSNHTVIMTMKGQVYTFGAHQVVYYIIHYH